MATKRKRLKNLTIKEVSLVGLGANQPARVALWKSADVDAPTDATKSAQPATQEKFSMNEQEQAAAIAKAAEQAELIKSLTDKVAAAEAEKAAETAKTAAVVAERDAAKEQIAKAEREALVLKTTAEAKDAYKALPGVAFEKFAVDIIDLRAKDAELAKRFEVVLKAASDAIAGSDLFKTVGSVVKTDTEKSGEDAYEQLLAKAMVDGKTTRDQAVLKVLDTAEGRAAYAQIVG